MNHAQKMMFWRILSAAALLLLVVLLPFYKPWRLIAFLVPYLLIGWDILWKALRNIRHGKLFDENFLMALATVGAFCIGEYPEGVFVMLFYQVGELFQDYAAEKSRKSITDLMNMLPEFAHVEQDGTLVQVDPKELAPGQIIVVKPGEKIPMDGVVLEGLSSINTMALTGESLPRDVQLGSDVLGGCVNLTGLLRVRVTKHFEDSTVSKILELVESASESKAKSENFITRFARYYTPAVVIAALALAVIPSLLWGEWSVWLYRALSFLVISCPCALVLSVPLSFFGGIGGAARRGILVKGAVYLEQLSKASIVAFDKTGTLTQGRFAVSDIVAQEPFTQEHLLEIAALAEGYSDHPLAVSLRQSYQGALSLTRVGDLQVLPGRGLQTTVDGKLVSVGNRALMESLGLHAPLERADGSAVHVAVEGSYAGYILLIDAPKPGTQQALRALRALGIRKTVMLTGDRESVALEMAKDFGIDEVHADLLPQDKVACVERLLTQKPAAERLIFVGDGINDAPVLSRADVGIAMGALGADAAMEAADVVIMDDDPQKVALAIRIARKTMGITRQNIVFSLGVKAVVLGLSIFGISNMWHAVLADVGVSVLAIVNAMRALKSK